MSKSKSGSQSTSAATGAPQSVSPAQAAPPAAPALQATAIPDPRRERAQRILLLEYALDTMARTGAPQPATLRNLVGAVLSLPESVRESLLTRCARLAAALPGTESQRGLTLLDARLRALEVAIGDAAEALA